MKQGELLPEGMTFEEFMDALATQPTNIEPSPLKPAPVNNNSLNLEGISKAISGAE